MRKWFNAIFTLAIIALLVYILLGINFYEVYLLIAQANLIWFGFAVLSMFLTFIVWAFRWRYIFKPVFKGDFWFLFNVLLAGSFFNTVTPGAGIGGEPFRAHYLSKRYKKSRSVTLGYVVGDTFFKLVVLMAFVVFSIFFVLIYVNIADSLKLSLELVLAFLLIVVPVVFFFVLRKAHYKFGDLFRKLYCLRFVNGRFSDEKDFCNYVNKRFKWFLSVFRKVVKNKNNLVVGVSLSFAYWFLNFLTAYFLFLSFGYNVNFLSVVIVFTLAEILGAISVIPGGMGVVEGSMTLLYTAMGISPSLALLVAFSTRIIYYFFTLVVGGGSLIHIKKKIIIHI